MCPESRVRAVRFNVSIPYYLAARSLGRIAPSALYGPLTGMRLSTVERPELPGPEWVRMRVLRCGICGSDLGNLSFGSSPSMEPFGSFPAVPGHEILAEVEETGSAVGDLEPGARVVIDPLLSCTARGYTREGSCRSCRIGEESTCENAGEDGPPNPDGRSISRGLTIGYHRDLPGGWGEFVVAHRTQIHRVPDDLDDGTAGLVEPLSIGMRAALRAGPPAGSIEPVLVIGSGTIAFATVWALRALGFRGPLIAQAKRPHEARMHLAMGATETVTPGPEARQAMIDTGAMAYQPIVGPEVYSGGGFPRIFDCVGNAASLAQAMRYAAPRGTVVLLGCATEIKRIDLSFLWARELNVRGFVGYGLDRFRGEEVHTFDITMQALRESEAPVGDLVTHVFPLRQYRTAVAAAANHGRSKAIKVALTPG